MTPPDPTLARRRVASPPPTDPQTRAEALSVAARALRAAEHVCVLTGAGVSAESGIPTFREAQTGIWARFSPQELATPEAFAADPERVWGWYAARRGMVRAAQPNPAHNALITLSTRVAHSTLVETAELAACLGDPRLVLVDVRHDLTDPAFGEAAYAKSHIPGAVFVHVDVPICPGVPALPRAPPPAAAAPAAPAAPRPPILAGAPAAGAPAAPRPPPKFTGLPDMKIAPFTPTP